MQRLSQSIELLQHAIHGLSYRIHHYLKGLSKSAKSIMASALFLSVYSETWHMYPPLHLRFSTHHHQNCFLTNVGGNCSYSQLPPMSATGSTRSIFCNIVSMSMLMRPLATLAYGFSFTFPATWKRNDVLCCLCEYKCSTNWLLACALWSR